MRKQFHLTQSGIDELRGEHVGLVAQRKPIADLLKQARELGDLSENAEYQTAREEQSRLEARISEIEHILQNVEVIKEPKRDGKVRLGSCVVLKGVKGVTKEYQIVGTVEANPLSGKISDESPIGRALLGKTKGEEVEIKTPVETSTYVIIEIK